MIIMQASVVVIVHDVRDVRDVMYVYISRALVPCTLSSSLMLSSDDRLVISLPLLRAAACAPES